MTQGNSHDVARTRTDREGRSDDRRSGLDRTVERDGSKADEGWNRRRWLRMIGAGAAATTIPLAGCSGGGGDGGGGGGDDGGSEPTTSGGGSQEPNHDVPHPSGDTVPDAEATGTSLSGGERQPGNQSEKDNPSVGFRHVPNEGQSCGTCSLFVPDEDGDGYGACTAVAGKIHRCDWCLMFNEYTGDGGIPCQQ